MSRRRIINAAPLYAHRSDMVQGASFAPSNLILASVENSPKANRYRHRAKVKNSADNFFHQGNADAEPSQK